MSDHIAPSPASLADAAYTAAVQAAVGGYGTWEAVQQAGIVAKCARRDQNNAALIRAAITREGA